MPKLEIPADTYDEAYGTKSYSAYRIMSYMYHVDAYVPDGANTRLYLVNTTDMQSEQWRVTHPPEPRWQATTVAQQHDDYDEVPSKHAYIISYDSGEVGDIDAKWLPIATEYSDRDVDIVKQLVYRINAQLAVPLSNLMPRAEPSKYAHQGVARWYAGEWLMVDLRCLDNFYDVYQYMALACDQKTIEPDMPTQMISLKL